MSYEKHRLGHVFISHSQMDKPFVRQLDSRLKVEGYETWLDEHQLLPGDPISETISKALLSSQVVLVVVSAASIRSRWLSFELNVATERMIQGECRIIPIVKERVALPPEVQGLLYADFSESFELGFGKVLTALQHETSRRTQDLGFWAQIEALLVRVFGIRGIVLTTGRYDFEDYETVPIPVPSGEAVETRVVYETIASYIEPHVELSQFWWNEYRDSRQKYGESLFLLVTERPVAFTLTRRHTTSSRVGSVELKERHVWGHVVVVDLTDLKETERRREELTKARELLIQLATSLLTTSERA